MTRTILAQAVETRAGAGDVLYRGADHAETAVFGVVVDGLLRFYVHAPDGRSMTVRYAGRGELVGVRGLALETSTGPASQRYGGRALNGEALQNSTLLLLPRTTVTALARRRAELSWALTGEIARQAMLDQELIATNVFSPIRARVARHLLMLGVKQGQELVLRVSHQEIADAIGSVREVVSRALCRFQDEGLVERRGRLTVLRDPRALYQASLG
ncbi:MAG TPA: Crp/Fnr family transcriptional regulator [Streptomyces sp.]|uniref:Crp/Fnr family transcriptional regulator n=1 Tax=Streptomyces sp. TaxID=1931 RepID=UPI002C121EA2|nr:Crp/Fnr family transcriptional regulator [Streptomyces sp.]HWU04962.1 Crp/Fnr family transcriptional regulator [Streptomyces sp.]